MTASRMDDSQRALDCFERAIAAAPSWAVPYFLIGSEYAALGDMHKAETAIANAVFLDPQFHIARYQLGLLQYTVGRAAAALVTWQPLSLLAHEQGLPQFVRGFIELAHDHFEEAKQHFADGLAEPDVNPSVAGDIRKVLAGMSDVTQTSQAEPLPPSPESASAHVLVSTYDKYRLH